MKNLSWFYPKTEKECLDLLNNGYRPHAGGTYLIKTSLNVKGLFDLSGVEKLRNISDKNGVYTLGADLSYAEAAAFLEKQIPGNILSAALSSAAATPLRNRISLGGSICAAPKWSDIIAPLYASGAGVVIAGKKEPISIEEFIKDRKLRHSSLVTALKIPHAFLRGSYYRFTITGFDYPVFAVAAARAEDSAYSCAVSGAAGGVRSFIGNRESILDNAGKELEFNDQRGMSGNYIKNRALIEFSRLLNDKGATYE